MEHLPLKNYAEEEISSEEKEWEVEEIVAHRTLKSKGLEYKVKWKGYPTSENTWEPLGNITNASVLIDKYWEFKEPEERMKAERLGENLLIAFHGSDKTIFMHQDADPYYKRSEMTVEKPKIKKVELVKSIKDIREKEQQEIKHPSVQLEVSQLNEWLESEKAEYKNKKEINLKQSIQMKSELEIKRSLINHIESTQNYPPPGLEDWEEGIREIICVEKNTKNDIVVCVLWNQNSKSCHPIDVASQKFPIKLIQFFENNVTFHQES